MVDRLILDDIKSGKLVPTTIITEELFQTAASTARKLTVKDTSIKALIYGCFKQRELGDVISQKNGQNERPGVFNMVGRMKYDAWKAFEGVSKTNASHAYIFIIDSLCDSNGSNSNLSTSGVIFVKQEDIDFSNNNSNNNGGSNTSSNNDNKIKSTTTTTTTTTTNSDNNNSSIIEGVISVDHSNTTAATITYATSSTLTTPTNISPPPPPPTTTTPTPPPPPPTTTTSYEVLDAVRVILCLWVVCLHVSTVHNYIRWMDNNGEQPQPLFLHAAVRGMGMQVDLFFVISGLLATLSFMRNTTTTTTNTNTNTTEINKISSNDTNKYGLFGTICEVLARRVIRIWPNLLVCIGLALLIGDFNIYDITVIMDVLTLRWHKYSPIFFIPFWSFVCDLKCNTFLIGVYYILNKMKLFHIYSLILLLILFLLHKQYSVINDHGLAYTVGDNTRANRGTPLFLNIPRQIWARSYFDYYPGGEDISLMNASEHIMYLIRNEYTVWHLRITPFIVGAIVAIMLKNAENKWYQGNKNGCQGHGSSSSCNNNNTSSSSSSSSDDLMKSKSTKSTCNCSLSSLLCSVAQWSIFSICSLFLAFPMIAPMIKFRTEMEEYHDSLSSYTHIHTLFPYSSSSTNTLNNSDNNNNNNNVCSGKEDDCQTSPLSFSINLISVYGRCLFAIGCGYYLYRMLLPSGHPYSLSTLAKNFIKNFSCYGKFTTLIYLFHFRVIISCCFGFLSKPKLLEYSMIISNNDNISNIINMTKNSTVTFLTTSQTVVVMAITHMTTILNNNNINIICQKIIDNYNILINTMTTTITTIDVEDDDFCYILWCITSIIICFIIALCMNVVVNKCLKPFSQHVYHEIMNDVHYIENLFSRNISKSKND